jgi:TIR domain
MTQKPRQRFEVFVSHSSRNAAFVERLVAMLHAHGLQTFLSRKNIKGAQQWHDEIGAATARCSWFIVVLTPQSVSSEWVKREFVYALQDRRYRGHIVPAIYKTCDFKKLSWTLSSVEYVDFRRDFDQGCRDLLAIWKVPYKGRA